MEKVDEMNRKVDRSEEWRQRNPHLHGDYMDNNREINWDVADVSFKDQGQKGAEEVDDRKVETTGQEIAEEVVVDIWVDRMGQRSAKEPVDTGVDTTMEGNVEAAVDAWATLDTRIGTAVEGIAQAVVDIGAGTTENGDVEEAVEARRKSRRSFRRKDAQENPKVFLRRRNRKAIATSEVDEQLRKLSVKKPSQWVISPYTTKGEWRKYVDATAVDLFRGVDPVKDKEFSTWYN
ncbi:hypothetical protein Fot_21985 [Forsythia ovata]|uniref:Uncharacterized protein n=1 Tax=Forsythia ovata TaxID=205694 RepID=A0ABD1UWH6_9LAMI